MQCRLHRSAVLNLSSNRCMGAGEWYLHQGVLRQPYCSQCQLLLWHKLAGECNMPGAVCQWFCGQCVGYLRSRRLLGGEWHLHCHLSRKPSQPHWRHVCMPCHFGWFTVQRNLQCNSWLHRCTLLCVSSNASLGTSDRHVHKKLHRQPCCSQRAIRMWQPYGYWRAVQCKLCQWNGWGSVCHLCGRWQLGLGRQPLCDRYGG